MTFDELSIDQRAQLAGDYLCRLADEGVFAETMGVDYDAPSWGDMGNAIDLVPSDVLEREYGSTIFTEDDFF